MSKPHVYQPRWSSWSGVPAHLRSEVIDGIERDLTAMLREPNRFDVRDHAEALGHLLRWLRDCDRSISKQRGETR